MHMYAIAIDANAYCNAFVASPVRDEQGFCTETLVAPLPDLHAHMTPAGRDARRELRADGRREPEAMRHLSLSS